MAPFFYNNQEGDRFNSFILVIVHAFVVVCRLSFQYFFFQIHMLFFQERYQSAKRFGSRSRHTLCSKVGCVAGFSARGWLLTQKLLKQGYRCHKLRRTFSRFIDVTMI